MLTKEGASSKGPPVIGLERQVGTNTMGDWWCVCGGYIGLMIILI